MNGDPIERPAEDAMPEPPPEAEATPGRPSVGLVASAAFLAAAGAGWAAGGLFRGSPARATAVLAAALGAGSVALAQRSRRPGMWQALVLPGIAFAGVGLAFAGGAVPGGVAGAVADAVRGGGPSGSAMAFEPGWRLLLVLLVGALAAGACSLGIATRRPRLAVLVAVPPLVGAAVVQPRGATLTSGLPAMAFLLGALAVSYGVELAERGASSRRFEIRRISRGVFAIVAVAIVLTGVSRAGALFPIPDRERVIPPQLPPPGIALPDRVLFTVRSDAPGPWRLGVLDVYDGTAWRLPPFDPARLRRVAGDGRLPGATPASPRDVRATVTLSSLPGPVLPSLSGSRIASAPAAVGVTFDPRTEVLRAPGGAPPPGTSYTLTAAPSPNGKELALARPFRGMEEFLAVPAPAADVTALLTKAPRTPLWDRLQYVRAAYYAKVVAAGAGRPLAVPPARVAEILSGKAASPYEITAAEVLLARWTGVPARIGYGFFEGDRKDGVWAVRPRHAATWLEAYFEGYGWVPVVGVPPRAKASLDQEQKKANPIVRPTEQLALVLYVPVRLRTLRLFYSYARFWIAAALPFVLLALAVLIFYPAVVKLLRRMRRSLWARRAGFGRRIAVAYAELRDAATDLNIADSTLTPVEFAEAVDPDDELRELSWLVSRALWGDLRRDLRIEDVEAAERMARSVTKRLRRAQRATARLLALASRASLREPYTREIPNLWPARRAPLHPVRRLLRMTPLRRLIPLGAVLAITLTACAAQTISDRSGGSLLPARLVPDGLGTVAFNREPGVEARVRDAGHNSLIDTARVFTFRNREAVQGYLELGAFAPGISGTDPDVRRGVIQGIGSARFKLTRVGLLRVYAATVGQQDFALWFAPEGTYFELLVARREFGRSLDLLAQILAYQGRTVGVLGGPAVEPADPRRGEAS